MNKSNLRVVPSPLSLNRNEMLQVKNDFPKGTQLLIAAGIFSQHLQLHICEQPHDRDNDWAALINF